MAGPCARAAQHTGGARPGPTRAALCAARCAEAAVATSCAAKCSSGDSVATPRAFTEPGRPRQSSSLRDVSGRVAPDFECNAVEEDLCLAVQVEGDLAEAGTPSVQEVPEEEAVEFDGHWLVVTGPAGGLRRS